MSNGFPADCHSCHTLALRTRVWWIYDTSHRMERWARVLSPETACFASLREEFICNMLQIGVIWRYDGFHKWGYPKIIHFKRIFHYKPSILGEPAFWETPICIQSTTCWTWHDLTKELTLCCKGYKQWQSWRTVATSNSIGRLGSDKKSALSHCNQMVNPSNLAINSGMSALTFANAQAIMSTSRAFSVAIRSSTCQVKQWWFGSCIWEYILYLLTVSNSKMTLLRSVELLFSQRFQGFSFLSERNMSATACSVAPVEQCPASKVRPLQFPPGKCCSGRWKGPCSLQHLGCLVCFTEQSQSQWLMHWHCRIHKNLHPQMGLKHGLITSAANVFWSIESSKNGGYKNNCKFGMSWDDDYPGFAE